MTRQLIVSSNVKSDELAAIGVTGTRSALVLLDAEGRLLRPSLPRNDDRYGPQVAAMLREWNETDFRRKAGNGINQERVGAKLRWIEAHEPDVHAEIATVSGSSDYVNWRLSGERAVEQNWALEAGLIDIETDRIDDALVAFAHCPQNAVPPAIASHRILGCTTPDAATETALPPGVPVVGGASGMIASALSAGIVAPGDVLLKFGSSVEMMVATDRRVPDARFSFDYHLIPGLFMLSRRLQNGGSALDWFATTFACDEAARAEAAGVSLPQHLDALAEKCPPGADGLVVVPSFLDANTPILDADAGAIFSGLTDGHTLGHLWRALLEGFAYAIAHDIEALRGMGHRTERFFVSDDGASSPIWMRIVADVTQQRLRRIEGRLCSCLGAAFTAAVGAGLTDDWTDAARFVEPVELIMPDAARAGMYGAGYERFRALSGAADPPAVRLHAVAWDVDGTLVDSEPLHHQALLAGTSQWGVDLADLPEDAFRGVHMGDVWTALRPRLPDNLHEIEWLSAIIDHYIAGRATLTALPGARETITALAARGIPQVCVSNSSRRIVEANLEALGVARHMRFVIAIEDVAVGKPDPEPYRKACLRLALPPASVLAVEDSSTGALSAHRAGLPVALCGQPTVALTHPVIRIDNLAQILPLFG